ncbi:MAG TPA: 3'(2'),5'-bisphosphate nucleotidase CysQ [Nitrospiraceae bacterium]|nr:3'(2'),5'-bisphosphate nucleotidase CysQ [Nitrospiraceae bacterium]
MEREQAVLCETVIEAGQRALHLASAGFETMTKSDSSPVTSADLEVNRMLEKALLDAFPEDGWLSEESPDSQRRLSKPRVWVVDPIDGTRAFMKGRPHFVISVALIELGRVVLGAIYNPSTGELFTAARGNGTRLNGNAVRADAPASPRLSLLVNPYEFERGRFKAIADTVDCRPLGSIAYSLALVASGAAAATITFERENEWDVAAGAILIEEAGGSISDLHRRAFRFNQTVPAFEGTIAASSEARAAIQELLHQLHRPT